jgi:hypothetical protein
MRIEFDLFASHSQIAIFAAGIGQPFNDWEQEHVDQGFAWRAGSVSFATLEEAGTVHCEALVSEAWQPHPDGDRAIRVPFLVESESVEIASISDGVVFTLGRLGACALVFETWVDAQSDMRVRFTFVRQEHVAPAVLRAGTLRPGPVLKMSARPA